MTIQITRDLRESLEKDPTAPSDAGTHLNILDLLITLLGSGNPQAAERVTNEILKDPVVANGVMALAVGVLAQCDRRLRDSAQVLREMDPEARTGLIRKLADDRGLPMEKASAMVDEYLKTI